MQPSLFPDCDQTSISAERAGTRGGRGTIEANGRCRLNKMRAKREKLAIAPDPKLLEDDTFCYIPYDTIESGRRNAAKDFGAVPTCWTSK